ncbi:alpha-mannosidase [Paenibacillus swuensis]|uniref:Alpha-mannosidase n=2 Tax=Paenibacillus swuensis TaxID=1178515 RepID=A0A172TNM9_9BACL|nr:alpha-mannosidase [Paenibacillus swuensis]
MPYESLTVERFHSLKDRIEQSIYQPIESLSVQAWVTKEPVPYEERTSGKAITLNPGDPWGELWDCAWFHFQGIVPAAAAGQSVVLLIDVNGELCVVDADGSPYQGLTNINSEYDYALGLPGKRVVYVAEQAKGGERIDLWGDAGCNDLFGRYRSGKLKEALIAVCLEENKQLYYDLEVLMELADQLSNESSRKKQILQALFEVSHVLMDITPESVGAARHRLSVELKKRGGDPTIRVSAIGHAHMDLAWLWPIRETIRKGARTFATALRMMEKYPDYVFGASQPQLYEWIKQHYPALFESVKQRIKEGRWEVQGAMWVEPDSNVAGGEALVRQILYGKRYFKQEFGIDVRMLWVPDIFGYSASLPQLLKKSGVDYMVTQKLSWNMYNDYPHHTFFWEGLDGSKVLTHLPPEDTYNSPSAPRSLVKIEKEYHDSGVSDRALMLFGIGDGGGGPGEEHLERLKREKNLLGLPPVEQEPSIDFLDKLQEGASHYKTWKGELYLEKHQGTLTTQARNKKFNRRLEKSLREWEFAASFASRACAVPYPKQELEEIWKEVLLYQFHDILPGSSIGRVYDESLARYEEITKTVEKGIEVAYGEIANNLNLSDYRDPVVYFNSLPWERAEWVQLKKGWMKAVVPSMGYCAVEPEEVVGVTEFVQLKASSEGIENEEIRVVLNEAGVIVSLFDKREGRELLQGGRTGNNLVLFDDRGGDAWDFPGDYRERASIELQPASTQAYIDGPYAVVEQHYVFGNSELTQRVKLSSESRQIVFETRVDWQESDKMLRSSFPLAIATDLVTSEIQFGSIKRPTHRNTSWDTARDEICAHHWIDVSESRYGVTMLNDSKYGHRVENGVLDINLLRSPAYPDPLADRAVHEFVYSILPHAGSCAEALVYKDGYELNTPLRSVKPASKSGTMAASDSLYKVDHPHIMIEAVKQAEDDHSLIIRLYETSGGQANVNLQVAHPYLSIEETNLMEETIASLESDNGAVRLRFSAFEIKTIRIVM